MPATPLRWSIRSRCFLVALGVVLVLMGVTADPALAEGCLECHAKPSANGEHKPLVNEDAWASSVHAKLRCVRCHAAADAGGFQAIPHRIAEAGTPTCAACHKEDQAETFAAYDRSVHATVRKTFSCGRCHNAHTMVADPTTLDPADRTRVANRGCIRCHLDSVIRVARRPGAKKLSDAHAFLPRPDAHERMRCVVCHTPIDGSHVHDITPRVEAIRACEACHDVNAPVIAKYLGADDRSSWVTNPILFNHAYVTGATRNRLVDGVILALVGLTVLGIFGHATLRFATQHRRPTMSKQAERVKMYPAWLRLWHWSNAALVLVLAYTGLRLHFGQRLGPILSFQTALDVHILAGVALTAAAAVYFVGNLISGNQRQYFSAGPAGWRGILTQARWYVIGIFKGDPHPFHSTPAHKFNPLQRVTYLLVMYGLFPLLVLSGVALFYPDTLPQDVLGHPGAWWISALHWLFAAALLLFLLGHLYLATMGDKVRDLYLSMIDGYHRKRTPRRRGRPPSVCGEEFVIEFADQGGVKPSAKR